jgi:hypothetical protein
MTNDQFAELVAEVRHVDRISKPVIVRPRGDNFEIVDGEHSWRAAKEVGLTEIPCEIVEVDDFEARRQTYKRNQHGTHDPIREGQMFRQMLEARELSKRALAREIDVSDSKVRDAIAYVEALDAARGALRDCHALQPNEVEGRIRESSVRGIRDFLKFPPGVAVLFLNENGFCGYGLPDESDRVEWGDQLDLFEGLKDSRQAGHVFELIDWYFKNRDHYTVDLEEFLASVVQFHRKTQDEDVDWWRLDRFLPELLQRHLDKNNQWVIPFSTEEFSNLVDRAGGDLKKLKGSVRDAFRDAGLIDSKAIFEDDQKLDERNWQDAEKADAREQQKVQERLAVAPGLIREARIESEDKLFLAELDADDDMKRHLIDKLRADTFDYFSRRMGGDFRTEKPTAERIYERLQETKNRFQSAESVIARILEHWSVSVGELPKEAEARLRALPWPELRLLAAYVLAEEDHAMTLWFEALKDEERDDECQRLATG